MNITQQAYTYEGLSVIPIPETKRCVVGGTVIDIRINDTRSTVTHATVSALTVIDRQGQPYCY